MSKLLKIAIILMIMLPAFSLVDIEEASAITINGCKDLKKLTSDIDLHSEKNVSSVTWTVHPDLLTIKAKYEKALSAKGWTIKYTSAYRSQAFQEHLAEIVKKASYSKCAREEKAYHGLNDLVASGVSNHTKGTAFDAKVYNKSGKSLNYNGYVSSELQAVAKSVGLKIPFPYSDAVHHDMITQPKTSYTPKLPAPAPVLYGLTGTVTLSKASTLYKSYTTTDGTFGTAAKGKQYTVVGAQGTYFKVKYNNTYAYVSQSNVSVVISETKQSTTGKMTATYNMRQYPYEAAKVVGSAAKSNTVSVLAVTGDWYKVKNGNVTGYIKAVKSGITLNKQVVKSEYPKVAYVTPKYNLNVRSSQSTTSQSLGMLAKNTKITITGKKNNWYSVTYNKKTGWISADYVVFK